MNQYGFQGWTRRGSGSADLEGSKVTGVWWPDSDVGKPDTMEWELAGITPSPQGITIAFGAERDGCACDPASQESH